MHTTYRRDINACVVCLGLNGLHEIVSRKFALERERMEELHGLEGGASLRFTNGCRIDTGTKKLVTTMCLFIATPARIKGNGVKAVGVDHQEIRYSQSGRTSRGTRWVWSERNNQAQICKALVREISPIPTLSEC